jgi:predicted Ser/Thr protein kinase
MSELRCCPQCGTAVQSDAPEGLCPQCLLKEAMKGESELGKEVEGTTTGVPGSIPPRPEELARQFPHLEILELLGQGGMGIVYKARQPRLDRFVALKILPAEAGRAPAFAERFAREARALAKLSHPNIVTVYDFGESDGRFYLLMEFVDGVNLRQLIRERRLKPEEALKIVPQICEALQYAHEQGIVHRDIKPENILLDKRGHIKIADFGLAKLLGQKAIDSVLTGSQQIMGTLHYMAPEQMEKPLTVDHRADIYSLGVVFYEMLTGELPLGRFAPPSQKVQLDVRLDEVVLRALEKEPERRYQHASDVKQQVESIQFATPVPSDGRQTPLGSGSREAAMQIVVGPADCLILIGVLAFVTALGVGLWLCLKWNEDLPQLTTFNLIGMSIANAVYGLFTTTAGALMRRLSARLFTLVCIVVGGLFIPAVGALNVALELKTIPQWPVLIPMWLGLPIAIWATLILFRHDVRAAFQSRPVPRKAVVEATAGKQGGPGDRIPLAAHISAIVLCLLGIAGVFQPYLPFGELQVLTVQSINERRSTGIPIAHVFGYESIFTISIGIILVSVCVFLVATAAIRSFRLGSALLLILAGIGSVLLMVWAIRSSGYDYGATDDYRQHSSLEGNYGFVLLGEHLTVHYIWPDKFQVWGKKVIVPDMPGGMGQPPGLTKAAIKFPAYLVIGIGCGLVILGAIQMAVASRLRHQPTAAKDNQP